MAFKLCRAVIKDAGKVSHVRVQSTRNHLAPRIAIGAKKERDASITIGELSVLRRLFGQLMCLATHVILQLQAFDLCFWVASALPQFPHVWKLHTLTCSSCVFSGIRHHFELIGWPNACWACRREGSSQSGHLFGITDTFLSWSKVKAKSVFSWHTGKLARVGGTRMQLN